ncbi:MAG: NAD(P)H-quinone dehydrogenase [bacterium]|nr:NAD(P)H-quinone dehydrogenase [bacterium]
MTVIGGGPGGYEAALVAAQLGAHVTLIEKDGLGGAAVLTDVVPSKTLIATAEWMTQTESADELGISTGSDPLTVDMATVNQRVLELAAAQSRDIRTRLESEGITIIDGYGTIDPHFTSTGARSVTITAKDGTTTTHETDTILISTGASPRELPDATPDGERILTWKQLYALDTLPEHLIVVGSGVTGAEFAGAYNALGATVTLVSSRDRVLPGQDEEAAELIESVFRRRGMNVLSRSRAEAVRREGGGVVVTLSDGREVSGSHCLVAVGAVPNTRGMGLAEAGVQVNGSGHIEVDRVSRTTAYRVYAAGDCTGVLPLASVAAMQGRIAMWHALGDAVSPLDTRSVAACIFTAPEIATIGVTQRAIEDGEVAGAITRLPVARNPRAKMLGIKEGFIKIFSERGSGVVIGGVVVAPRASELIYPVTLAVANRLTVDQVSSAFTIYPSLTGSLGEAARTLHGVGE